MPTQDRTTTRDLWFLGSLLHLRATGEDTGGAYAIVEEHMQHGLATPEHVHHREDEALLILDGELSVVTAGHERIVRAGDYVFLPREVPHRFAVVSPTAHVLTILSPAGFEQVFVDLGEPARELALPPAPDGQPDVGQMIRVLGDYGVEVLGGAPPPEVTG